jgi:hypothetical protein
VIPLYGFVQGDTLGLLALAQNEMSIAELRQQLQQSASVRVAPRPDLEVWHQGRRLELGWTVNQAGLKPLDRIDLRQPSPHELETGH